MPLVPLNSLEPILRPYILNAQPWIAHNSQKNRWNGVQINGTTRIIIWDMARRELEEDTNVDSTSQENMFQLQCQQQEAADRKELQERDSRQAMAITEAEAQRHAS